MAVVLTEKLCTLCKLTKPLDAFNKSANSATGRHSWCRECHRQVARDRWADPQTRAHMQEGLRAWREANPEARRLITLRHTLKKHGLTLAAYEELVAKAGGVCQICRQPDPNHRLVPDHDHRCCPGKRSCGKCLRGVLCSQCNRSMGGFKDSADLLRAAAAYLESANAVS